MTDPDQIRINELARECGVKAKAIVDYLPEVGVTEKKHHSSSIDLAAAEKVRKHFRELADAQAATEAAAAAEKAAKEAAAKAARMRPVAPLAPVPAAKPAPVLPARVDSPVKPAAAASPAVPSLQLARGKISPRDVSTEEVIRGAIDKCKSGTDDAVRLAVIDTFGLLEHVLKDHLQRRGVRLNRKRTSLRDVLSDHAEFLHIDNDTAYYLNLFQYVRNTVAHPKSSPIRTPPRKLVKYFIENTVRCLVAAGALASEAIPLLEFAKAEMTSAEVGKAKTR